LSFGTSAFGIDVMRGTPLVFILRLRLVLLYGFGSGGMVVVAGRGGVGVDSKKVDTSTGLDRWGRGASFGAFSARWRRIAPHP
jgi:hypothetical protein